MKEQSDAATGGAHRVLSTGSTDSEQRQRLREVGNEDQEETEQKQMNG